jgi:hypothetical protein
MSEIYYAFIVFPVIFIIVMGFIFQQNTAQIQNLNERLACPNPEGSGIWNDTSTNPAGIIRHSNGTYNYEAVGLPVNTLTCTEVHTLDGFDYFYGVPTVPFAGFPFFVADWLSEIFGNKAGALAELVVLFVTAPSQISGLGWYIYVDVVLFSFIIIGGIMIARG